MSEGHTTDWLKDASRVVVKLGSALLVDPATNRLNRRWLESLIADIAELKAAGKDVLIVSSGAVALGRRQLHLPAGQLRLEESQAAAAVGQINLAHAYQETLSPYDHTVAQVLLTLADTEERRRYLNARSTLSALLRLGAIPLINENDTVATTEIRYGDNDRLAARVASMISADCLILLSDVDGLYTADPSQDGGAQHIAEVAAVTPEIEAMAGAAITPTGSGGMITKVAAAKIAVGAGCRMAIASGRVEHPLKQIRNGARCTWFAPHDNPLAARKKWIAGTLQPMGAITIDAGAARALEAGKSLLPPGVTAIEGTFDRGDAVIVKTADGHEIGRGLSAYGSSDAALIIGHKSRDIEEILGYRGRNEIIHRDDLVLHQGAFQ